MQSILTKVERVIKNKILGIDTSLDYRYYIFQELKNELDGQKPKRILEIGPKDGQDSMRLLSLNPDKLVLIDLPRLEKTNQEWLDNLKKSASGKSEIQYISANVMYDPEVSSLEPFDLVWCTGVLYHNPEQLRMLKKLYDLTKPGGRLVLESATARHKKLMDFNCVEIIYPVTEKIKKEYHISSNVTHLPSAKAMESWLGIVGFDRVNKSKCLKKVSKKLEKARAAFIAFKAKNSKEGKYYDFKGENNNYVVGKSL